MYPHCPGTALDSPLQKVGEEVRGGPCVWRMVWPLLPEGPLHMLTLSGWKWFPNPPEIFSFPTRFKASIS